MADDLHRYRGDAITVAYDARRCIHVAECVQRLPTVFNTSHRPWVQPDAASVDAVVDTVERCPTGALRVERADGEPQETPPAVTTCRPASDGPLFLHGDLRLHRRSSNGAGSEGAGSEGADESIERHVRIALCRCGATANQPFCDGSHRRIDFQAAGQLAVGVALRGEAATEGPLEIRLQPDGPAVVTGPLRLCDENGTPRADGAKAAFCRCGATANQPFCDGSHARGG
ncbi:MAG: CDGSH iron-sulfur domain-containing protein [Acidobacteriota bacterium]